MRILFTICGRAGSRGIRNKNLRMFCGRRLAYYSVSVIDLYLLNHPEVQSDIVVNSDSAQLLELIANNGMRPVEMIVRDAALAGELVGKIEVIRDCLEKMEMRRKYRYDMVVDLDITSPLRRVKDLERVIELHSRNRPDVTTTVVPARRNPYFNQVMRTERGYERVIRSGFTARQQAPEVFDMNASIYAYSPAFLAKGQGVLDGYCEVVEMWDSGVLDLDHESDFELMEAVGQYLFSSKKDFAAIRGHIPETHS